MQLRSDFAGTPLRSRTVTVEWRRTMNYAAAVGDNNPIYFNDENPSGLIAPPMFCVALTWPITGRLGQHIESADFPAHVLATQVHYTEHIEIHRPIRPGEQLIISGKIAAILPHRSGTHAVIRFDAADQTNAPVFTEHIGGLMRGVQCVGEAAGRENLPNTLSGQNPQEIKWRRNLDIDALLPFVYDGCTDIFFPIHTSVKFAKSVGLPGIIVQGTATLALAVREITNVFGCGNPAAVTAISCRFTHMVTPASRITIECGAQWQKNGRMQIPFLVKNQEGKTAISNGTVVL